MGCLNPQGASAQQIEIEVKKLKHEINLKIDKLKIEALNLEKVLVAEFRKPKAFRAVNAENSMASQIALMINKIQIYEVVKCHVQKVIEYSHHLSFDDKSRESIWPSLKEILYTNSILKDESIGNFCGSVRSKYPEITEATDEEIKSELIKYHKKNEFPNHQMVNEYLLNVVNQEQIDLAIVNSVGHDIRFGK